MRFFDIRFFDIRFFFRLRPIFALLLALTALPVSAQSVSNQLSYSYSDGSRILGGMSPHSQLIDPRGAVLGCDGTPLPSYQGFHIGLYAPDPTDPTGTEISRAVPLTPTSVPAEAGLPLGTPPNAANANPFALSDTDKGRFTLLLDPARGQTDAGRVYILLLTPPSGSVYRPRRIRITVGETTAGEQGGSQIACTATSLDGAPLSGIAGQMTASFFLMLPSAASANTPALPALTLTLTDCPLREVQITKTGDRATAEPGDIVVYRIMVTNTTPLPLGGIDVIDTLPVGFDLRPDSVRAAIGTAGVPALAVQAGRVTTFSFGALTLTPKQTLTLAYALLLTPDALRGDGKNAAVVTASALMTMNGTVMTSPVSDGPAVFTLGVRQGILTDTGTILGRIWIDRSRDGEQQDGEPGLPGAVILLDDSTRIVADSHGLFSLPAVPAGYHSAILDMQSVPGYVLARSRFKERRSQSRMVHITPGGMVRVNFGVVPAETGPPAPNSGGAGLGTVSAPSASALTPPPIQMGAGAGGTSAAGGNTR